MNEIRRISINMGALRNATRGIIKVNETWEDDYFPSLEEFDRGYVGPLFKETKNFSFVKNGLFRENGDVSLMYVEINDFNLPKEKLCGAEATSFKMSCEANFKLIREKLYGNFGRSTVRDEVKNVQLICSSKEGKEWLECGSNGVNLVSQNNGDSRRSATMECYAYNNSKKYSAGKTKLVQYMQGEGTWVIKDIVCKSVLLESSVTSFSKEGGLATIIVKGVFDTNFEKVDPSNNTIDSKKETEERDITDLCIINLRGSRNFVRAGREILVGRQLPDGEERNCTVTATYLGKYNSNTITLTQERGDIVEKVHDLYFADGSDDLELVLAPNETEGVEMHTYETVKYVSQTKTVVGDETKSVIKDDKVDVYLEGEAPWLNVKQGWQSVNVKAMDNESVSEGRNAVIVIKSQMDGKEIRINIRQLPLLVVDTTYIIGPNSGTVVECTYDDVDNMVVVAPVRKKITYSNGLVAFENELPKECEICEEEECSNSLSLSSSPCYCEDCSVKFKLIKAGVESAKDVVLIKKITLLGAEGTAVSETGEVKVILKGTNNPSYTYVFKPKDSDLTDVTLEWDMASLDEEKNIILETYKIPTEVGFDVKNVGFWVITDDENYSQFEIIKKDNILSIKPLGETITKSFTKVFNLIQNESGKRLTLVCAIKGEARKTKVLASVRMRYSDGKYETSEGGNLKVWKGSELVKAYPLGNGWVSDNSSEDELLRAEFSLYEGVEYTFEAYGNKVCRDGKVVANPYQSSVRKKITGENDKIILIVRK